MSKIELVTTPAIASNTATVESDVCEGLAMEWRIDVLQADGVTPSVNTCTVTIKDNIFERTLFTKTGVTGTLNFYDPYAEIMDSGGTTKSLYKPFTLANQRFTVTVTSGTNGQFVKVWGKILR
jgi:hypothetical protein